MKALLKNAIGSTGFEVRRQQPIHEIRGFEMLASVRGGQSGEVADFVRFVLANIEQSKSQIFQDLFVLYSLGEKHDGYFVEFGAADGEYLSNTVMLERHHGWTGILSEPGRNSHEHLLGCRNAAIDLRCVWDASGKHLTFSQNPEAVLSTISEFANHDDAVEERYMVETVSLNDMLDQHRAPPRMGYLSIDTEGSELTILKKFDFTRYSFEVITVEHNYSRDRSRIFDLLTAHGYQRKFEQLSMFDDWYVRLDR
jgi:FkbM family methyltransferase